ncbi:hypothetical protein KV102_02440 [Mumia sp. zg.B53]|uniref:hypothetical protein n=1 Tax=unclassified Mumia TaxID=2621872 RepID=UPI001C6E06E0|nr:MULTISPECIES: hypothetical protein [unclassified Mumia]MBW9204920.1 hypothetical protein [Mumia sp. zg.B17]MBW9213687.1 hypothetical protein [Mumia sp. zg.B53]MDD9349895.1 hypothetical protein [Mumia sp.]
MLLNAATVLMGTVVSLVLLGLVMGFSPTLIATQVAVVARSRGSVRPGLVVACGVATGALVLSLVLQVVNPDTWDYVLRGKVEKLFLQQAFDEIAGVLFVVAGIWLLWRRPTTDDRAVSRTAERLLDRPRDLFTFAVLNTVVGVSGAATTYLVVRLARESTSVVALQVLVYVGFAAAAAAPYVLLAWGRLRIPALAGPADRVVAWVRSQHWRRISAVLLIVAGTLLFVAALTDYFGLR